MRILYIDCDSLRPDHLGCYGYHRDTSPNIDRVADNGLRFTKYYASDAPCDPSRTALFTGRFGFHTGVVNHGGINADLRPQGPDRNVSNTGDYRTWMTTLREQDHHTTLVSPFPQRHAAFHVLDGFDEWHDTKGGGTERAEQVYPYAERWLNHHATDEDWYLHVNFWDPHASYDTPTDYGDPFADDPAPEWPPENIIQDQYESYGPHSAQDVHGWGETVDLPRVPDEIDSREEFVQWINGYDVGIRYMDEHIGRLFEVLETAGVFDETLIIVSADHGENQGELNVYGDHQTADHWTCRVPLVMHGPGVEPGVDDGFHYNLDLPPTITDLVGGDIPAGWDGRSFAETVTDGAATGRESLVVSQGTWACQRAVLWDEWLLIRTYHDGFKQFAPVELYDLDTDPHETMNLAQEHPEVVRDGIEKLDDWKSERLVEATTGRNGGNPDAPRSPTDPLFEVIQEGGPHYPRGNLDAYAERLRDTDRAEHAAELERREGIVHRSVNDYLAAATDDDQY